MLKMSSSIPRLAHGRVADDEKLEHVVEVLISGILLPRLPLGRHLRREEINKTLINWVRARVIQIVRSVPRTTRGSNGYAAKQIWQMAYEIPLATTSPWLS